MPNSSIRSGKQDVFGTMETSLHVNRSNAFGISSNRNVAKDRLTDAWQLTQHLLWGAKSDL